jgi:hypothetical protein
MAGFMMLNVNQQSDKNLYNINTHGYRCPEFNNVEWSSSFVVMGCSRIFGESLLDDSETVPGALSSMSSTPTINLGVCGSGIDLILFNTMNMISLNYIPKAVFVVWPDPERFIKFKNTKPEFFGSWSSDQELSWLDDNNAIEYNHRYATIVKHLWQTKNVPLIEVTHHTINSPLTSNIFTDWLDVAPDGVHWGPKTCQLLAQKLFNFYLEA